jgi:hypothetical protein
VSAGPVDGVPGHERPAVLGRRGGTEGETVTLRPVEQLDADEVPRCDRCGARVRLRAVLPDGGELLFCGAHARAHTPRLRSLGATLNFSFLDPPRY